jgi:hypothetical protein
MGLTVHLTFRQTIGMGVVTSFDRSLTAKLDFGQWDVGAPVPTSHWPKSSKGEVVFHKSAIRNPQSK